MKRFRVRGFFCAISFAWMPFSLQAGHSPTTTSGSWFVEQCGSMQMVRGLLRNAVTFTWGMPHVGHGSGTASTLPFGSGYVTSQSGQPAQPMNMLRVFCEARSCRSLPHFGHGPT